jgi:hypothetical protein
MVHTASKFGDQVTAARNMALGAHGEEEVRSLLAIHTVVPMSTYVTACRFLHPRRSVLPGSSVRSSKSRNWF